MIITLIFIFLLAFMKNISIIIDIQYCLLAFKSNIVSAQTFYLCHREAWEGRKGGEDGVYDSEKDIWTWSLRSYKVVIQSRVLSSIEQADGG